MISVRKSLELGFIAAGAMALAVTFVPAGGNLALADGHHHGERHEAMKSLGGSMKSLGAAVAVGNNEDAGKAARDIAAVADQIPSLFETKAIPADSRAKPEIWDNWDDFVAKASATGEAAEKVAADAAAGTLGSDPKVVLGSIGATCGACHKTYRGPET